MNDISDSAFLKWAASRDIVLDKRYPDARHLVFRRDHQNERFWECPGNVRQVAHFVHAVLTSAVH